MAWTTRADLDRYFATADPTFAQIEALGMLRAKVRELADLILDLTPASADQSASIRSLREAEWAAQAALLHQRGRAVK